MIIPLVVVLVACAAPVSAAAPENDVAAANAVDEACPICGASADYDGPLTSQEVEGLLLALNDEYHAWAVYDQVIADLGSVRPFSNIRTSEQQHIDALVNLFEVYGVEVPDNPWIGNVPSFASKQAACQAGVDAEIANADLYDELFASTDRSDILQVYESLQWASLEKHLPAFQRCAG